MSDYNAADLEAYVRAAIATLGVQPPEDTLGDVALSLRQLLERFTALTGADARDG